MQLRQADENISSTLPKKLPNISLFDSKNNDISELVNRYLTFDDHDSEEINTPTTQIENIEHNENRDNIEQEDNEIVTYLQGYIS
ncbi:16656_t:CDS:2 [Gigaspora margarita]|uniref:16656_t:CDS:1 n=1 Tax=Gigaspora margarita TaxID=4874 RepID=A0ABN7VAP2_GIGMA|nr:16656_t:CDS:2 [Gigaspora margarita]